MSRWTSLGALAALSFAIAACAPTAETGFPDPADVPTVEPAEGCAVADTEPTPLEGSAILVLDNCYRSQTAVIAAGTQVTWRQEGSAPHNIVFSDDSVNSHPDCSFEDFGACMSTGDEFRHAFTEAGEFPYYCVLHGSAAGAGMAGTVIVE